MFDLGRIVKIKVLFLCMVSFFLLNGLNAYSSQDRYTEPQVLNPDSGMTENENSAQIQVVIPRKEPARSDYAGVIPANGRSSKNLIVKFKEGSGIKLSGNGFIFAGSREKRSVNAIGADATNLAALNNRIKKYGTVNISRLFSRSEQDLADQKSSIEKRTGKEVADLNLYFRVSASSHQKTLDLLNDLMGSEFVETAYIQPVPSDPEILGSPELSEEVSILATKPNYQDKQLYLNAAPQGINAKFAWSILGGTGSKVKIFDIEIGWNKKHEDLAKASNALLSGGDTIDQHGTAVIGELIASKNGYGVTGIAYGASLGLISHCPFSGNAITCANYEQDNEANGIVADAIDIASSFASTGDVILVERQFTVVSSCSNQEIAFPVEYYQAEFDAIEQAVLMGRNVIEPAGNGGFNLDDQCLGGRFDRDQRDSGAIMAGAGNAANSSDTPRSRLSFSNYGTRLDVQGYGNKVVTTGYGDLKTRSCWSSNCVYTQLFNGTSAAAPIVAGSAALISSIAEGNNVAVNPGLIRDILISSGTPQQSGTYPSSQKIGPLPDLKKAIIALSELQQ